MTDHVKEKPVYSPFIDIVEKKDGYLVMADFPGAKPDTIEVKVEGEVLTVTAKTETVEVDGLPLIYREYGERDFETSLRLGDGVDRDKIEAELKDGVLVITMPKAAAVGPRKIAIKAA